MVKRKSIYSVAIAAVLCAVGILIPMTFPKIVIPPASFTLASHVAIFIALFISPGVAAAVCIGTTLGFVLSGLPFPIWMRAATHIIFALIGAFLIKKDPTILKSPKKSVLLGLLLGLIHAVCEVLVITPLYFGDALQEGFYSSGFLWAVIVLVGLGTLVHSCIDYAISIGIWKALEKVNKNPVSYK
jgi:niacin transporter